ncbi:lipid-A-disaccharide synthase [Geovibrio thiophilus]|uniref:Lipid-A-disaccharide synthase n=1 Tax=Geovibrio thiophilus TaxID=139438 RepID=A0A410JWH2_9BACT|nr:lipid-A-disaccharide synthase [Geovibrio thiophilus]QAR32381.1 lipid-A-disaccharide synthase [Geovibrio thiophilus]
MLKNKKLFIIAGEQSGDTHAANLLKELSAHGEIKLYGTGGAHLRALGQEQYYDINDLSVIGFDGIIKKLPFFFKVRDVLLKKIEEIKPDAVILADYPGFNLRFAQKLENSGIPVIYFVAPQVWAWNYKRVKVIKRCVDLLLCILPFEEDIFRKEGINAHFIGNPVVDHLENKYADRASFFRAAGLDPDKKTIGILPGSRRREVETLLPVMLDAADALRGQYQFIISKAESVSDELLAGVLKKRDYRIATLTADIMKHTDLVWVCSGTASLETAVSGTPMVILYKVGGLTALIGRLLLKIKFIGLPNLVAGRAIVPEAVQDDVNPAKLIDYTEKIFSSYESVKADVERVGSLFRGLSPSKKGAELVAGFLKSTE